MGGLGTLPRACATLSLSLCLPLCLSVPPLFTLQCTLSRWLRASTHVACAGFGGFDIYIHVYCLTPPGMPPPPSPPPPPPEQWGPPPAAHSAEFWSSSGGTVLIAIGLPVLIFALAAFALVGRCWHKRRRADRVRVQALALKSQIVEHDVLVSNAIRSLPSATYQPHSGADAATAAGGGVEMTSTKGSDSLGECSICLSAFQAGEQIKTLSCGHTFKKVCIDTWLNGKGRPPAPSEAKCRGLPTCPLCKAEAVEVAFPANIAPPGAKLVTVAKQATPSPMMA